MTDRRLEDYTGVWKNCEPQVRVLTARVLIDKEEIKATDYTQFKTPWLARFLPTPPSAWRPCDTKLFSPELNKAIQAQNFIVHWSRPWLPRWVKNWLSKHVNVSDLVTAIAVEHLVRLENEAWKEAIESPLYSSALNLNLKL